jgi:hypothetical protein
MLALALSLCLVWTLLACVLVCASHIGEASHNAAPCASAIAGAPHDDDCCPIIVSTGVRAERISVDVSGAIINAPLLAPEQYLFSPGTQARLFMPAFRLPFARLCTLRI